MNNNPPIALPGYELGLLWRYFDGVSRSLASRFDSGSPPAEEFLTYLLCELLDDGATARHVLEFPLSALRAKLDESDGGLSLSIKVDTHEHTKHTESNFSGSDLGIVLVIERDGAQPIERAVLLQAKKLFPSGPEYTALASFKHFDDAQFQFLRTIGRRFGTRDSIFYLWYSPASTRFREQDAKWLRRIEASSDSPGVPVAVELDGDDLTLRLGRPYGNYLLVDSEREQLARTWRRAQPGTRVSNLTSVKQVLSNAGGIITLQSLYLFRARKLHRPFAFAPFADLLLVGLLGGLVGDSGADWVRLARGEKVQLPPEPEMTPAGRKRRSHDDDGGDEEVDLPERLQGAKHTLTVTLHVPELFPEEFFGTNRTHR